MTIRLEARFDWMSIKLDPTIKLRAATEDELRYELFLGDLVFIVDGMDFSAEWGWVPLLDFSLSMTHLVGSLPAPTPRVFEFTESGAQLRFYSLTAGIEIRTNYSAGTRSVQLADLSAAVAHLRDQIIADISQECADVAQNPAFLQLLARNDELPS